MANNLKKFQTELEYSAATLSYPAVSWITDTDNVYFDNTPPTPFEGKWKATYADTSVVTADCDASSAITQNEIVLSNLVEVEIGDCVTSIGNYVFGGCRSLSSVTIPNSVTSIGDGAFYTCQNLSSIDIPNSVTSIGGGAFTNCTSLTSVTIPSGVTDIDGNTFAGCSSLTSIVIPSGVTSISNYAFRGCSSLTSITVEATTPPTLGMDTFDDTNNCPIYVPSASVAAYQADSGWSEYASRIQAIPNS